MVATAIEGDALIDQTGSYRYWLKRWWSTPEVTQNGDYPILWVMLNPSTANASINDPTIHEITKRSAFLGYRRLEVVNLFAYRSSKPMYIPRDFGLAVGQDNDRHIVEAMNRAHMVIAAWGAPPAVWLSGMVADRIAQIRVLAESASKGLYAMARTSDGAPKHPLARGVHRIPDKTYPQPWEHH